MNLDIRLPIGFMFGLFGVILTAYGLFSNPKIYDRSLGINVNLEWGVALLLFAAAMLVLGWRHSPRSRN
jgi:multisubunit Na+/H+ antiporter MnhG subunit